MLDVSACIRPRRTALMRCRFQGSLRVWATLVQGAEREDLIGFIPGSKDLFYSAESFVRPCH